MLGTVAAQALDEAANHEVAVGLQNHIDEVDDDDAADVAQAQLADDFFGRFEVVLGDGLFEGSAGAGELSCVDVDDGHRFRAVNHERTAGGQIDLAVERFVDLLGDAVVLEDVVVALVARHTVSQVRCDRFDVFGDDAPHAVAVDHELGEVFVEDIADDAHHHVRFAVEEFGGAHLIRSRFALDRLPALVQALNVLSQVIFRGAFGGCAHNDARAVGDGFFQDRLQTAALAVGKFARNAGHLIAGNVHEEPPGQRDLRC